MKIGFYTWGSCFVERPGMGGPDPYSRHHTAQDYERAYMAMLNWAKRADELGYDSFWLTEHHFQREGYEVIPNMVLMGSIFAQHTQRITFGSFFMVTPTWHPLRLAEDLAMSDILTGGRVVFGAGRGSVEREAKVFGSWFGRGGDEGDRKNRELFEEQMEIINLALTQPEFNFHGKHFDVPPAGILNTGNPQTGRAWDRISLVPQPVRPIKVYQACASIETFHMSAKAGNTGVLTMVARPQNSDTYGGLEKTKERWKLYGDLLEQYHGRPFGPGEKRMLVVSVHLGATREEAFDELRAPLTERSRFIAQQRSVGVGPDGLPFPVGYVPTLDEMLDRGNMLVGSPEEVSEELVRIVDTLGVEEMAIEMGFPGMLEGEVIRQMELFAARVRPALERTGAAVAAG